jgi:hypothetical protein
MIKTTYKNSWTISKYFKSTILLSAVILYSCGGDNNPNPGEEPIILDQEFNVFEHSEPGTSVGTITATDPDSDDLVFSISTGNEANYFEIDQTTGELSVGNGVINFETLNSHLLEVSVTDGDNVAVAKISVSVEDIDECEAGLCPNYLDIIYTEDDITISNSLRYGNNTDHKFDFYSPELNYDPKRPLVIVFPFSQVDNPKASVPALQGHCKNLARRGYAVALAYERESVTGSTFKEDIIFYIRQVHDQKAAIRHFKKEAGQYGLDTMNFFLSGWSLGSVAALLTAQLELADIEQMVDGSAEFQEVYNDMGFEGTENLGYSSDIRGVTLMTLFVSDLAIIDEAGPAMMIIHNENTTLAGTLLMGLIPYNKGAFSTTLYGPDLIKNHALTEGYTEGANLGYILMDEESDAPIFSTTTSANWNDIARFYHRNLDR